MYRHLSWPPTCTDSSLYMFLNNYNIILLSVSASKVILIYKKINFASTKVGSRAQSTPLRNPRCFTVDGQTVPQSQIHWLSYFDILSSDLSLIFSYTHLQHKNKPALKLCYPCSCLNKIFQAALLCLLKMLVQMDLTLKFSRINWCNFQFFLGSGFSIFFPSQAKL